MGTEQPHGSSSPRELRGRGGPSSENGRCAGWGREPQGSAAPIAAGPGSAKRLGFQWSLFTFGPFCPLHAQGGHFLLLEATNNERAVWARGRVPSRTKPLTGPSCGSPGSAWYWARNKARSVCCPDCRVTARGWEPQQEGEAGSSHVPDFQLRKQGRLDAVFWDGGFPVVLLGSRSFLAQLRASGRRRDSGRVG